MTVLENLRMHLEIERIKVNVTEVKMRRVK